MLLKLERKHRVLFLIISTLLLVSFIALMVQIFNYQKGKSQALTAAKKYANMRTELAAKEIRTKMERIEKRVDTIAQEISSGKINPDETLRELKILAENDEYVDEAGITYLAGINGNAGQKIISPYFRSDNKNIEYLEIECPSDITQLKWLDQTIKSGAGWSESYFEDSIKKIVVSYNSPIYVTDPNGQKNIKGVIRAVITLNSIKDMVNTLKLGRNGYSIICDSTGTIIYHPISSIPETRKSIFEFTTDNSGKINLNSQVQGAIAGDASHVEVPGGDKYDDSSILLYFQPVSNPKWVLAVVYLKSDLVDNQKLLKHQKIWILIGLIIFLSFLVMLITKSYLLKKESLWLSALSFSILCLIGTGLLWFLTINAPLNEDNNRIMITDIAILNNVIGTYKANVDELHYDPPIFVPTGVQIQTLEFINSNEIEISGVIWQKYNIDSEKINYGFAMPQAKSLTTNEIYRKYYNNKVIVGWQFNAKIREQLDFSKYPFDRPDIRIWIKHKDFDRNVVLVPDLESYKVYTPAALPGLSENIALPGYDTLGAFFDYDRVTLNTDYGIMNYSWAENFPELHYNIVVGRQFLTPFISRLFSLLIVIILVFIVQLKFSADEEKKKQFGISGLSVLGVISASLLPTVIAQSNIRNDLGVSGLTYIENFHIITYVILLITAINAYIFIGKKNVPIIQYEDCLIPKILYWPVFSSLVFVITLRYFY